MDNEKDSPEGGERFQSNPEAEYFGFDLYPDRRNKMQSTWYNKIFRAQSKADLQKQKCEMNVIKAMKKHPMVRTLVNALENAGCPVVLGRHICCEVCDSRVTGGYDVEWNQIVICQNLYKARTLPEITLIHELIHMYDYCVNKVDFKNLEHLACSEIRAANLTHCSFLSSWMLGQSSPFNIKNTHQYCVKMKAAQSMMVARDMDFDSAFKYVLKVFDKCYSDLEPIGRRVRRGSCEPLLVYRESKHYGYGGRSQKQEQESKASD